MLAHRFRPALSAFVALCVLTSIAGAQRGGGGGMGRGGGGGGGGGMNTTPRPPIEIPRFVNAVNLLVAHRQDLALSDSQFAAVIRVKRSIDSTDAPLMRRLDSVQVLFKGRGPLFGDPSAQRRDSLSAARVVVSETVGSLRENLADAREKAYAILSASQISKAQDFESKEARAIEEENESKASDRGGRGGAGAGRPPE